MRSAQAREGNWAKPRYREKRGSLRARVALTAIALQRLLSGKPLWLGVRGALLSGYVIEALLSPTWSMDRPAFAACIDHWAPREKRAHEPAGLLLKRHSLAA